MTGFFFDHALLPEGWSRNVRVTINPDGMIGSCEAEAERLPGDTLHDHALPGMANLHSHAFQRGMAGLSEQRGTSDDSFWTWREVMYAFNDHLTPEDVEAIAALVYCEMLETGFTSVGEFHYLHHDRDGTPFSDLAEMSGRICRAAQTSGIALTLLPVFYRWAGFDDQPTHAGQRRFFNNPDRYAALIEASQRHLEHVPFAHLGVAPHSLRAANLEDLKWLAGLRPSDPIHIHIAEQTQEVEDCMAAHGRRPVDLLMDTVALDQRWCLVHATHMTAEETRTVARSGAVAGLCPLTEANLGDGIFPADDYRRAGGRVGIGSDSHIRIDLPEELRLLEYGQRLLRRQRNVLADPGEHLGQSLYQSCALGGAAALGQRTGQIAVGMRADFVTLDVNATALLARQEDTFLDSWMFAGSGRQVDCVYVGGKQVVTDGRCLAGDDIRQRYAECITALMRRVEN